MVLTSTTLTRTVKHLVLVELLLTVAQDLIYVEMGMNRMGSNVIMGLVSIVDAQHYALSLKGTTVQEARIQVKTV